MNLQQALVVLRLRWWVVLLVFVATVSAALAFSLLVPKRFAATTSILLDIKTDPLVATLAPNLATPAFIATQSEIIRSDRLASRVVQALGLDKSQAAVEQWREATAGRIPIDAYFGELLRKHLTVEPGLNSAVINLTYAAPDAKFAAAVANAYAQAYLEFGIELKIGPARQYESFFDERAKTLRTELEAAQARLAEFQRRKGVVVSSERYDLESARLASLEAALATALAESAEASSRQRNAGGEMSVDVLQSAAVQGLKAEVARAETRLNEISTTYGPNHPTRIQLEAQIAELKQQLGSEMRRVAGATVNVNRIASQKLGELRGMIETQKKALIAMRGDRDEASVLVKDVETAQRAYEQVTQRRSQLANESQADQAAARILSPALEPLTHKFPNVQKNMVASVILGLLLGLGAALGWEAIDRRIRSAQDIHMMEGVPVLGVMSSRKSSPDEPLRLPPVRRPVTPPQLTMESPSA